MPVIDPATGAAEDRLPDFLEKHRLHGLLLRGIRGADNQPNLARFLPALADRHAVTAKINQAYLGLLGRALDAIPPGVPVMLLKGGDLILRVYDDPGLRPLDDIDLLVAPEHRAAVESALAGLGFRECGGLEEREHHAALSRKSLERIDAELNLPFFFELHWDLRWMFYHYKTAGVWRAAQTLDFSGKTIRVMHPADRFLYLGLHWLNHWRDKDRLLWACDLAWLIATQSFSWAEVKERGVERNLMPALWIVLKRLRGLWDAGRVEIPEELLELRGSPIRKLALKTFGRSLWGASLLASNALPVSCGEIFKGIGRTLRRASGGSRANA